MANKHFFVMKFNNRKFRFETLSLPIIWLIAQRLLQKIIFDEKIEWYAGYIYPIFSSFVLDVFAIVSTCSTCMINFKTYKIQKKNYAAPVYLK